MMLIRIDYPELKEFIKHAFLTSTFFELWSKCDNIDDSILGCSNALETLHFDVWP